MLYGSTAEYTIDGATFVCKQAAGPRWQYQEAMADISGSADIDALLAGNVGAKELGAMVQTNKATAQLLTACVTSVSGLVDS